MKRLRWVMLLLLALLMSFFIQAEPSAAPEISDSPNHKFRVVIETIRNSTNELEATMLKIDGDSAVTHWIARIPYFRRTFPSPDTYVSDKGDFFVRVSSSNNVTFFRKDPHSNAVRGNQRFGPLIYKLDDLFPGVEEVRGVDVLRLWNREHNRWDAYDTLDASDFRSTPEDISRWNEIARQEILEKLHAAQREELQKKARAFSAPLARLVGTISTNSTIPSQRDYEFLATLRNPEDRKWIEELLMKPNPVAARHGAELLKGLSRAPYCFERGDYNRSYADWLLGYWDKKASWEEKFWRSLGGSVFDESPRYALAKVTGTIRLPLPMPVYRNATQATILHIRLIRAEDAHKNSPDIREERLGPPIGFERGPDRRRVYEARFAFTTVLPGTYQLKAIWDKRRPLSDTNNAGPGDYESVLSAAFVVTAGATGHEHALLHESRCRRRSPLSR